MLIFKYKKKFLTELLQVINQTAIDLPSLSKYPEVIKEFVIHYINIFNKKYDCKFDTKINEKVMSDLILEIQNENLYALIGKIRSAVYRHSRTKTNSI